MKKLIFRKLITDIASFFLISSLAITLIVWVIQAVNYLDFVSEDGHSFKVYFMYSLLTLPKIFSKIMIFLFFISIFIVITKYEENNEILVFWTHGIKKIDFMNVLIIFSFIILILHLSLTVYFVPKTQDMGRSYIRSSNIDYFPSLIKSKQFIDTVAKLTIFIENKKENGEMENIFLKDKLDAGKSQIISAKKGYIINDKETNFLVLYDGKIINIDGEGTNIIKFKKTNYNLSNYETKTTTYPKIQEQEIFTLLNCINSFFKYNTTYKTNTFSCEAATINTVIQEVVKRFFSPLYILIITFIAGSLIFKSKSDFNYNKYRIILFLLGVISIVISEFSIQYITYKNIFNIPILVLPFLLTFIIYITIIFNTKRKIN